MQQQSGSVSWWLLRGPPNLTSVAKLKPSPRGVDHTKNTRSAFKCVVDPPAGRNTHWFGQLIAAKVTELRNFLIRAPGRSTNDSRAKRKHQVIFLRFGITA